MKFMRKVNLLKFLFHIMKEGSTDHEKLFKILGDMRGVPQKYGQFLYLKDKRKYKEFKGLLDEGIPYDNERLYKRALKLTNNEIVLNETPMASASIGQVYAGLLDNKSVIVKVQYPHVKAELIHDWKFIKGIIGILFKFFRFPQESKEYLVDYLLEFEKTVDKETDYTQEVDNQLQFQKIYQDHPFISIPHVYENYLGFDVIVEEKCKGIPFEAFMKTAAEEDKREIMDKLLFFYFDSFFQHGLLHGDPHSGNFFVNINEGKLILEVIDFGCVKYYEQIYVENLRKLILILQHEEYEDIHSILVNLGFHMDELNSYGKALVPILNVIFEPFLMDEAYDFKYWRMSYKLNTIMGSKLFDKTLSLPKDLLVLFRVFHGIISHIYGLKDKEINVYKFFC